MTLSNFIGKRFLLVGVLFVDLCDLLLLNVKF